ncbi:MAG TPA: hypothetical protein VGD88_05795 [Opitutaceae bacterium]
MSSTHAATVSGSLPATAPGSIAAAASKALTIGIAGIVVTALGLFVSGGAKVSYSWLVGLTFWTGIAIGMLFLVMIHHIVDASWSTVIRRQFEHGLAAFLPLGILFIPLVVAALVDKQLVWKWFDPAFDLAKVGGSGTVGEDVLWVKKSGLLNPSFFVGATVVSFAIWIWLSSRLRKASFTQDLDGDLKWTSHNRTTAAFGLALTAFSMTLCIIFWVKSLDYHFFSTMYGVWYFAGCIRAALSAGVIIMVWLYMRGDYKGILNNNHMHSIGQLMFAFTVFWAYITFSQYFLIWNANVPEETFWYSLREINNSDGTPNQWKWVGLFLLFGHFFLPFLTLIHYPVKLSKKWMPRIGVYIALVFLLDLIYNVWPSKKNELGDPLPFLGVHQLWTLSAVVGIGGVCVWAYLKSFPTAKLIPIRDPRITESLTHHE